MILFFIFIFTNAIALYYSSEVLFVLIGMYITIFSVLYGKGLIFKPVVWLSIASFLYSFGGNIVYLFEGYGLYNPLETALFANIFHFSVCFSLILFDSDQKNDHGLVDIFDRYTLYKYNFYVSIALVLINIFIFYNSGASSKREFSSISSDSDLGYFGFFYSYFVLSFVVYAISFYRKNGKIPIFEIICSLILSFFTLLVTGERDVFFKIALSLAFMSLYFKSVKPSVVYFSVLAVILFVPFSKSLGVSLGSDSVQLSFSGSNFIVGFMKSDFASAGSNLDILLLSPDIYSNQSLSRLFEDIVRGFLPTSLSSYDSSTAWFYKYYTPYSIRRDVGGLGFSLMGAFYIYGSVVGVIIGGFLYGCLSSFLWKKANRNDIYLSIYFSSVPLLIWSLRGDVSTIISSLTKQTILPIILIVFIYRIFRFRDR
ncbi:O-antigen polymerase [Sphingopyxis sp. DBS4]|uniref:O-antigen polymerase n=1 Tax=Sphingopyxis sp. DBS4 TaxID=2968500 RepID=UPI00214AAE19|nr:O-antigen polymerase [Sphingopyxis sp. DBS4]